MARTKEFDKDAILEKAIDLFRCKGYSSTSAQDLVDALAISRSSLYDTYGDKRSLFLKVLSEYSKREGEKLKQLVDQCSNPEKVIKLILQNTANCDPDGNPVKGCLMINTTIELAPHDEEIAKITHAHLQVIEEVMYQAVKKGQAAGQFTSKNSARGLARFFVNNLSGLNVANRSKIDKKAFDDIVRITLSALY